ncbi:mannose-1-phosphate guanylyltransferase/mannose-6-phosphate isomerase [Thauera sp.]|uniref:mannose-1-phosphate guanylyltransferase/mannose-6-phosphate isomerase n=1 Tax=Thauera sp. TaxID=1905334 RepID=UPI002C3995AD|nr:mannose-1-phosphate guanylyltransferase/mannose-6-phosphate isomerase [Thauera sp.]HRO36425.1 mannose-1-phosphate guanylyltransferase/mannose-6-phosphate isomerase [Thauera sp.]
MTIKSVILSGGSGTRLWPASRESYPKQLLPLTGERSLLQETALRLKDFPGGEVDPRPLVVTNEEYRFIIAEQLRQIGVRSPQIVLEPVGRNTAPALTLAALAAAEEGDPILLVMPADHVITEQPAFQHAIAVGAKAAAKGALVTFGILPDRAETGYGYIRSGEALTDGEGARALLEFVEKPDRATAEAYVASGAYYWNSGIFMMKASVWLAAIRRFAPEMAAACAAAVAACTHDADFIRLDTAAFERSPSDSIDYAVMEKLAEAPELGQGVVVPLSAGWSDVGAWDALWAVSAKDGEGNAARGEVLFEACRNTLVHAGSRLVAAVGCEDMVVVETPDAVMVAHKDRTQDVKKVVARLKAEGRTLTQSHRKVYRPWGWYDSIDAGERFQVKRIVVNPGAKLSLQMHHHRAEHWIVVKGTAEVTNGERSFLLAENESTYIPLGHTHRLSNPGKVPLEIIEVQSGSYLGEDDIVRFEDTYGRNTG